MNRVRVEVTRAGRVESVHDVDVAIADGDGRLMTAVGVTDAPIFTRSAVKPFQALPLVEDGVLERFGLTDEELAVCCASHSGEPRHVAAARSILSRIGLEEDALACGPHPPFHEPSARALVVDGLEPGRIHNNCSGKHAGMLALARSHDWPVAGYQRAAHPVQRRMLEEIARWTGLDAASIPTGVDGCGVVTFALPLAALAGAFGRLARAAADGEPGPERVVRAMTGHPFLVGGTDRLCTRLMEATEGRILAKVGAEGVYGAAATARPLGIALKVRDGAKRASEVALLAVLTELGLLDPAEREALEPWARPTLRNTRDEPVGTIRAVATLEPAGKPAGEAARG